MYRAFPTGPTIDTFLISITTAACFLGFAWLVVFPTFRGSKLRTFALHSAYIIGLYVLTVIFIGQYSFEWKSATIHTETQLQAGNGYLAEVEIGLHIGLRGFNITVIGTPIHQFEQHIDYNDQYYWAWLQGRQGFGIHSGRINREFRASQVRGAPYPILWIAEYFTLDGEWIRWGRYARWGGYYAHVCLWASLPCWFFAVCLWPVATKPAAVMTMWTGFWQTFGCILYTIVTNLARPNLIIPFADGALYPVHGWSFWMVLFTGVGTLFLGLALFMGALYWKLDDYLRPSVQPLPLDTLSFSLGHLPEAVRTGHAEFSKSNQGLPDVEKSAFAPVIAATQALRVTVDSSAAQGRSSSQTRGHDHSLEDHEHSQFSTNRKDTDKLTHKRDDLTRSSASDAPAPDYHFDDDHRRH